MPAKLILTLFWAGAIVLVLQLSACGPAEGSAAQISFNEVMASNSGSHADESGEFDDWIELYNASDQELDLEGYFISDDQEDLFKKRLPAGLRVPATGTLLLWADSDPEQGTAHLSFKLKATGEVISLTSPEGELLDQLDYQGAVEDQVFGRFPDADGAFVACATPTPDAKNGARCPD